ncbi:MAG: non-ribosomal peptide synthetase, partial [Alphaproteobacteria bacterium]|nr:non-ribosomal peptide synthetase [Alphaproteobacteria bacterium]
MIEHKSVVSFCFENNYSLINNKTVTLGYSNYAFDGSIFDIFVTLLNAGKLILVHKDTILNEFELSKVLIKNSINTMFITTALFVYYSKLRKNNPLNCVSNLLFGGEKLNVNDLEKFLSINNNTDLIHVYGPTENIVFSTYYCINPKQKMILPIGKKLLDKTLYVLATNLAPLPIGAIGELYIGGVGLARGYLNRA